MSTNPKSTGEVEVLVRRGRVDSVDLFEVKEHELELLENGEPTGIYLNFSIFLLSIALTAICTLLTATFSNQIVETCFLILSIVGILGGAFLLILWIRGRKSVKSIINKIRGRIPPELIEDEPEETVPEPPRSVDTAPRG